MVTVLVGPEAKKFHLHRDLLMAHSSYFRDCLKHRTQDDEDCEWCFEEDNAQAFGIVAAWLYEKYVPVPKHDDKDGLVVLVRAYRLAARFDIEACQNTIMDAIRKYLSAPRGANESAYKVIGADVMMVVDSLGLPEDSPLRTFFIKGFIWEMNWMAQEHMKERNESFLPDHERMWTQGGPLVIDIMRQLYSQRISGWGDPIYPADLEGCEFHTHERGSTCANDLDIGIRQVQRQVSDRETEPAEKSTHCQIEAVEETFESKCNFAVWEEDNTPSADDLRYVERDSSWLTDLKQEPSTAKGKLHNNRDISSCKGGSCPDSSCKYSANYVSKSTSHEPSGLSFGEYENRNGDACGASSRRTHRDGANAWDTWPVAEFSGW